MSVNIVVFVLLYFGVISCKKWIGRWGVVLNYVIIIINIIVFRCVLSFGMLFFKIHCFIIKVDLVAGEQTNTKTNKARPIRRIAPPEPAPPPKKAAAKKGKAAAASKKRKA